MGQEGHANDIQTILYHSYSKASSVTLPPPTPPPPGLLLLGAAVLTRGQNMDRNMLYNPSALIRIPVF